MSEHAARGRHAISVLHAQQRMHAPGIKTAVMRILLRIRMSSNTQRDVTSVRAAIDHELSRVSR